MVLPSIYLNGSPKIMSGLCFRLNFFETSPVVPVPVEMFRYKLDSISRLGDFDCVPVDLFPIGCSGGTYVWPTLRYVAGVFPMMPGDHQVFFAGTEVGDVAQGYVEGLVKVVPVPPDLVTAPSSIISLGPVPLAYNAPGARTVQVLHIPGPNAAPVLGQGFAAVAEDELAAVPSVYLLPTTPLDGSADGEYTLRLRFRSRFGSDCFVEQDLKILLEGVECSITMSTNGILECGVGMVSNPILDCELVLEVDPI